DVAVAAGGERVEELAGEPSGGAVDDRAQDALDREQIGEAGSDGGHGGEEDDGQQDADGPVADAGEEQVDRGVGQSRTARVSRVRLLISTRLILCIYLVFRILACSRRLNASNLFLSLILHLGYLFLIVQLHFSELFLILKSGVNHSSRGSISTSTLPSIKLRKCSSKIITSILSFISGRLATKSNQIKQLIRNGRSASLQRTFKKSFTSFSHSTRNKTRDGLIRVRNIRALNGRFNTSITHAYSIVIGSKHITLNATGGGFLT